MRAASTSNATAKRSRSTADAPLVSSSIGRYGRVSDGSDMATTIIGRGSRFWSGVLRARTGAGGTLLARPLRGLGHPFGDRVEVGQIRHLFLDRTERGPLHEAALALQLRGQRRVGGPIALVVGVVPEPVVAVAVI